jgi:hypothetical protein
MNLGEALNSINFTKKNLIRNEDGTINEQEAKSFPSYVVLRSLSYHSDCVPYVAYLNQMMAKEHNMTNAMQYEFLLYTIPKGKRFSKWAKPKNEKALELLMEYNSISYDVAKGYLRLMTEEQINELLEARGGKK